MEKDWSTTCILISCITLWFTCIEKHCSFKPSNRVFAGYKFILLVNALCYCRSGDGAHQILDSSPSSPTTENERSNQFVVLYFRIYWGWCVFVWIVRKQKWKRAKGHQETEWSLNGQRQLWIKFINDTSDIAILHAFQYVPNILVIKINAPQMTSTRKSSPTMQHAIITIQDHISFVERDVVLMFRVSNYSCKIVVGSIPSFHLMKGMTMGSIVK